MDDATALILDLLARGHAVQFRARGDSMHPVIRDNDLLHVEPARHFVRGDVVLVLAERGLTAHRVVSRRGTTIVTRGDNAPAVDDPCEAVRVLGKVTSVDRDGVQLPVSRSGGGGGTPPQRRLRRRVRSAG
jgi:phage repressor protein C with HTH and peptisase S24 domain